MHVGHPLTVVGIIAQGRIADKIPTEHATPVSDGKRSAMEPTRAIYVAGETESQHAHMRYPDNGEESTLNPVSRNLPLQFH